MPVSVIVLAMAGALGSAPLWLPQRESAWEDPLRDADFTRVTDFVGAEEHAAISRDGRFIAFVSDREGTWDIWVGAIEGGAFRNVTNANVPELRNPAVRMLGFSPAGEEVLFWTKATRETGDIVDYGWSVPIIGGPLRRTEGPISERDWSADAERIVYHPSAPGDPLFVAAHGDATGGKLIYAAPPGVHCHFPLWSPDGDSIYFVRGNPPEEMDIWRVAVSGGEPEQLTFHGSRVSFPTLLDDRTLLYLATSADGSGPWLHALDLERRESHRVGHGQQRIHIDCGERRWAAHRRDGAAYHGDALEDVAGR
jgi:hypothetical protein